MSKKDIGFCSCFPCGIDEGPCFFDYECQDNLFCGFKNCPTSQNHDNCCTNTKDELLKSPNYPAPYKENTEKIWIIIAPIGSIIKLKFHSFHTEAYYDFLTIYDGPNDQSTLIGKLSGNLGNFSVLSTGNSAPSISRLK